MDEHNVLTVKVSRIRSDFFKFSAQVYKGWHVTTYSWVALIIVVIVANQAIDFLSRFGMTGYGKRC